MTCALFIYILLAGVADGSAIDKEPDGEVQRSSDVARSVDFDTEIVPVLTKAGCNSGACHGAAAGRGGFHLSLLGSDPASDYYAIVTALEGRRINLSRPERSLLLAKPTGRLPHGGDVPLPEGEGGEQRLLSWIKAGAPRSGMRRLTSLDVTPSRIHLGGPGGRARLRVTARFDGGLPEDVTAWTLFTVTDKDAVALDDATSMAEVRRRGQHVIIARFLDRVVPLQINVPFNDGAVELAGEPRTNFIDEEILKTLTVLRLNVSPPVDDSTFLRRVRLDLTGKLPDMDEVEQFLNDDRPQKRTHLVDRLLASEEFVDYWTLRFSRTVNLHGLPNETEGVRAYSEWLRRAIKEDMPLDAMARELITATGDAYSVGPANFGRMVGDARAHAELVGRVFMGVRLECANCHNHPLDKWTQDDYHGLAAVFARLERGRYVQLAPRGSVTNLRTGEPAAPRIPGERYLEPSEEHLEAVAHWLTSSQQKYFARATVNRLWQAMFGRGLIEPTEDLRETNPATHPELLERLAQDFIDNHCSLRHTLRTIALSHAYGRGSQISNGNAVDDRFYSRATSRLVIPEVLADAISDVTGVPDHFPNWPEGTRAVQLLDPLTTAPGLDNLGRCSLNDSCEETTRVAFGVSTHLHLINGELINGKLASPTGRLHRMIDRQKTDSEIVQEFFVRALCRQATESELTHWCQRLSSGDRSERAQRLEDFVWSLLNSRHFLENH